MLPKGFSFAATNKNGHPRKAGTFPPFALRPLFGFGFSLKPTKKLGTSPQPKPPKLALRPGRGLRPSGRPPGTGHPGARDRAAAEAALKSPGPGRGSFFFFLPEPADLGGVWAMKRAVGGLCCVVVWCGVWCGVVCVSICWWVCLVVFW